MLGLRQVLAGAREGLHIARASPCLLRATLSERTLLATAPDLTGAIPLFVLPCGNVKVHTNPTYEATTKVYDCRNEATVNGKAARSILLSPVLVRYNQPPNAPVFAASCCVSADGGRRGKTVARSLSGLVDPYPKILTFAQQ